MLDILTGIVTATWLLTARMAPYLLLGFLVAGVLSVFLSPAWLERHLGGRSWGSIFKASLLGVPLPLCSCGVIPVAASLRRSGASGPATTAFLLSTPQTGVDSILVTWTLLGPLFAVFRPVIALVTGFLGGGLVQALVPARDEPAVPPGFAPPAAGPGPGGRIRAALDYGLVTLPGDIARALLVGLVVAGVLAAVIPEDFLAGTLGRGPLSILLMMVVGIPIYVCATASVPLAASFLFLGASPGAALAFLIAGPATNAATVTTVGRVLGRRTALVYLLTVALSAFGGGLLLDWLLPRAMEAVPQLGAPAHEHGVTAWWDHLWALALAGVMTRSWWLTRRRHEDCGCGEACPVSAADAVEQRAFTVVGMRCSHCSDSVQRAVGALPGVRDCVVDAERTVVTVRGEALDGAAITAAIESLGYRVTG